MKKVVIFILLLSIFTICICGCNTQNTGNETNSKTQIKDTSNNDVIYEEVNVDLSSMSGTIAYSQVYDMLYNPSKYEGKIVKMKGPFSVFYSKETSLYYPAVIIKDATACCAQGIEFVLHGNPDYPSGYPKVNKEITVVGEFEIYYEGTNRFCHLINAIIL